jgi:hypothetical protein
MFINELKMNCTEFKHISLLFIDNELSEEIKSIASAHLTECASCSSYLKNMSSVYSATNNLLQDKKADLFFYTRLKARMEQELAPAGKKLTQISYYLKPAFYSLIAFTILLSVLLLSGNVKTKQQVISPVAIQTSNTEEQDYLKTIAMNDKSFEEEYINILEK